MTSRKQVQNLTRDELLAELERLAKAEGVDDRGRQVIGRLIGEYELPPDALAEDISGLTVYERLSRVKAEIGALGKTEQMSQDGGYRYRGIEAILNEAHDALVRYGVVIAPIATEARYDQHPTRSGSGVMYECFLEVAWGVWGPQGDRLDPMPVTRGEAFDSSDKSSNKAHTAAFKVLLSQLFAIPYAEHDPDHERPEGGAGDRQPSEPWDPERARAVMERWENLPLELASKVIDRMRSESHWDRGQVPTDWPPVWADRLDSMLDKAWEAAEAQESAPVAPGAPETGSPDQTSGETGEGDTAPVTMFEPDGDGGVQ